MRKSMVDIQPVTAEIRRGNRRKKETGQKYYKCGPMPT